MAPSSGYCSAAQRSTTVPFWLLTCSSVNVAASMMASSLPLIRTNLGKPITLSGVTKNDVPPLTARTGFRISPESGQWSRIHNLDRQVILTMVTTAGNLWRLDGIDR
jgi:hypothetical protein